jgi:hypothetical protein
MMAWCQAALASLGLLAVLFRWPPGVVAGDEVANVLTELVEGLVDPAMHDLLPEGITPLVSGSRRTD